MRKLCLGLFGIALITAIVPAQETKPAAGGVVVDKEKRTVTVPAKVAPRKVLDQVYPIELIAGWGAPKGKKAHEIVVSVDINPSEVHKGLEALGLKPGKAAKGENTKAEGPEVKVYLEVPGSDKKLSLDKVLMDPKSKKPAPKMTFRFTGSVMSPVDPNKPDEKKYGADLTGTLIALFPVTDECVLQTDWTMKEEKYLKLEVNPDVLPKEGADIKLIIEAPAK
ncbi:MAG: YdjY domain-containing protein [Gemmataceae bacterium]